MNESERDDLVNYVRSYVRSYDGLQAHREQRSLFLKSMVSMHSGELLTQEQVYADVSRKRDEQLGKFYAVQKTYGLIKRNLQAHFERTSSAMEMHFGIGIPEIARWRS